MATSTLIQKLFGRDELASSEDLGQDSVEISHRVQKETFYADATIAAGDAIVFDCVDGGSGEVVYKVIPSPGDAAAIGVAVHAASQHDKVVCVISGICEALVKGADDGGAAAISAGDYLCASDAAGVFYKYTPGVDAVPHAIAVDDVGSGAAASLKTIIFLKQF